MTEMLFLLLLGSTENLLVYMEVRTPACFLLLENMFALNEFVALAHAVKAVAVFFVISNQAVQSMFILSVESGLLLVMLHFFKEPETSVV